MTEVSKLMYCMYDCMYDCMYVCMYVCVRTHVNAPFFLLYRISIILRLLTMG